MADPICNKKPWPRQAASLAKKQTHSLRHSAQRRLCCHYRAWGRPQPNNPCHYYIKRQLLSSPQPRSYGRHRRKSYGSRGPPMGYRCVPRHFQASNVSRTKRISKASKGVYCQGLR